ncbi:MAG: DCC1-like thiol-disulfide oxidoreductase family protein [Gemmatimonadaceae bacterium]
MARATSIPAPTARRSLPKLLGDGQAILLYDGVCGLCDGFVQFVLRHDKHGTLKFATLQGKYGEAARSAAPELAKIDSLVLLTPSGAYVRSTAALEVLRYIGGIWATTLVLYGLPRALRDWGYDQIAARRYRMFGKYDSCPIPDASVRARFLD